MENIETRKEMAARLRERTQELYPDYRVDYWWMQCSDALGVSLCNEKEYISAGVYKASILDEDQLMMAIKLKLDAKSYDSHTIYHKNIRLIDEIVERTGLHDFIGYTDILMVMPTDESYEDAPLEFDISENGVIEVAESEKNISVVLDEGKMVIDKLDRSIRVTLD